MDTHTELWGGSREGPLEGPSDPGGEGREGPVQAVLGPMACQAPTGIGEDPWPKTLPQTRICSPLQPGSPPHPSRAGHRLQPEVQGRQEPLTSRWVQASSMESQPPRLLHLPPKCPPRQHQPPLRTCPGKKPELSGGSLEPGQLLTLTSRHFVPSSTVKWQHSVPFLGHLEDAAR